MNKSEFEVEWNRVGLRTGFQKFCLNVYGFFYDAYVSFMPSPEARADKLLNLVSK